MKDYINIKFFILIQCIAVFITNPVCGIDYVALDLELGEIKNDDILKNVCTLTPTSDDYMHYDGIAIGPTGTPYEGGKFKFDVSLFEDHPMEAPKITFKTQIYHPNIKSENGEICLDILKRWNQVPLTLKDVLYAIMKVLEKPEVDDQCSSFLPLIALEYKDRHDYYLHNAKQFFDFSNSQPTTENLTPSAASESLTLDEEDHFTFD